MKAVICLLLLATVFAASVEFSQVANQVKKLQQTRYGKLLVEIAELHTLAKGPLEDLVDHLARLVADSTGKRDAEQKSYDLQENAHDKQVDYLNGQIRKAQTDVINTRQNLRNVLTPLKKTLEDNIHTLQINIRRNLETQAKYTQTRKEEHAVFIAVQTEHRDAIAALDQAIKVVDNLRNPSLVQVHILRTHLSRIENALKAHDKYEPLIESLVQQSSFQKLQDINAIRSVIKLLNELRESIINDLNEYTRVENAAQAAYNDRMTELNSELTMFRAALARDIADLAETIKRIKWSVLFIQTRNLDLKNFQNELKAENARWVSITALHTQYQKDITDEIEAATGALNILRNANFASFLKEKLRN